MNPRFCDYVTSGAFSMTLTRQQISTLGGDELMSPLEPRSQSEQP